MPTPRQPLVSCRAPIAAAVLLVAVAVPSLAAGPGPGAPLETRARWLETHLMAPCCGANAISDHYSAPAAAMRGELREMLRQGMDEQAILDVYVERHGEKILSMPPARGFGLVAYLAPIAFGLVGAGAVWLALARWRRRVVATPPGAAERSPAPATISAEDAGRIERELERYG